MLIKFHGSVLRDDMTQLIRYCYFSYECLFGTLLVATFFFAFVCLPFRPGDFSSRLLDLANVLIIMLPLISGVIYLLANTSAYVYPKNIYGDEFDFEIDEQSIRMNGTYCQFVVQWGLFQSFAETKQVFLLFPSKFQTIAYFIPKRYLQEAEIGTATLPVRAISKLTTLDS